MSSSGFTLQKVLKIFNSDINRNTLIKAESSGKIPSAERNTTGAVKRRLWDIKDLPKIGEQYGFLKKLSSPLCVTVFVTKGGVLKTTLTLNLARLAALHNIKTCIVGLDMQADITNAFGINVDNEQANTLEEAIQEFDAFRGLNDFQRDLCTLDECIVETDIPSLSIIPETSELVSLEASLQAMTRREDWLKDNVIAELKKTYDLIIIDSPPNWNQLVSNALVASDVLLSPLECKINHYRNVESFVRFIDTFKKKAKGRFKHIFIPTKHSSSRKLSGEIRKYYISNISNCITTSIRESTLGEEATASSVSLIEQAPGKIGADEMREAIVEIWNQLEDVSKENCVGMDNSSVISASVNAATTSSANL